MSNLAWMHALQALVPNERLGRIASVELLATYGLIPVGLLLAGWATNGWGAAAVCLLGGALTGLRAVGPHHLLSASCTPTDR